MRINNKKDHLSRISAFIIMLLFTMCVTMNGFFGSDYCPYELLNKTTVNETWASSESVVANEDGDNSTVFKASFLNKSNSYHETITKNISSIFVVAAIPHGISQLLFLTIAFLFILLTFFILLPDEWTLINQKVRLDN